MAQVEEQILAAGAFIVWVQAQQLNSAAGTAEDCRLKRASDGSDKGWCVGDGATQPTPRTFDNSPFVQGRGFEMIIRKSDMRIMFEMPHGTPTRNDDLSGEELLQEVRNITGR